MNFPSKKKLFIYFILGASVLFNLYIFGTKFLDTVRMEGYQIAILSIIETAQSEKEVTLKYQDKEKNQQKMTLIVPTEIVQK